MKHNIPLAIPQIEELEKQAVLEVLKSGWLTHGKYNEQFESKFANYIGLSDAIAMNSCTSALEIALKVNGIKGQVIVPSFTFVATANAIINAGATPIFCDVDFDTRNVTSEHLENVVSKETEAVMVVHWGGQPCNMQEITTFCSKYKLLLVEDSAETIGAKFNGKQAGSFGIGCFSFFPTKNMTTGEGGMLTCNNSSMADTIRTTIGHGISKSSLQREKEQKPWQRSAILPGHNFRMSNLLAAIGYHQIDKLDSMNNHRKSIARIYDRLLKDNPYHIKTTAKINSADHVYQMYTITVDEERRDDVVNKLRRDGIGASVHFDPPVHLQEYYRTRFNRKRDLENTERLSKQIISLPIYQTMPKKFAETVVETLIRILERG